MDTLRAHWKLSTVSHQQWYRRGDPARYGRVTEQMVHEVKQAVEHHDGKRDLKWHAEQFGHQRNGGQIHGTHQQALEVVRDFYLVVNKRQPNFERTQRDVRAFAPLHSSVGH
ncbi:hypothetical protein D3C78_1386650 [compost metagenome]